MPNVWHPQSYVEETNVSGKVLIKEISFFENNKMSYFDSTRIQLLKLDYQKNIAYIDSIRSKLTFNRNKEAYEDMLTYFTLMNSYFKRPCDTCLIRHDTITLMKDSLQILLRNEYLIDSPYIKPLIAFDKKREEILKGYLYANSPNIIQSLLIQPLVWVGKKLGLRGEKSMVFTL